MASTQSLLTGDLLARRKVINVSAVTAFPAMQIQYIGTSLFGTVAVAAGGDMTLGADDTDGTTAVHTIDLSTPGATVDTFGELAAVINGFGDFRCFLLGVRTDQSTDNKLDTLVTASCRTDNGLTIFIDEAEAPTDVGVCITNRKYISRPVGGIENLHLGETTDQNCINSMHYLIWTVTAAGTGNLEVIGISQDDQTTVSIWDDAIADATGGITEGAHGATPTPDVIFLAAPRGYRIVVYFDMAAAVTATDLRVIGQTKHIVGGDVPSDNYTGCV